MSWEITSGGGTLAFSLGHPGAGQKCPSSLTTSELKQAVRGSSEEELFGVGGETQWVHGDVSREKGRLWEKRGRQSPAGKGRRVA